MKEITCCFSGHRKIPYEQLPEITFKLEYIIEKYIHEGYCNFISGDAFGFDMLAAKTVLNLKKKYPHIKLLLILPCVNQTKYWRSKEIEEYENIKAAADNVEYVSKNYTKDCLFERNRRIVDRSGLCICYLTDISSGTGFTVNYARKKDVEVVNLKNNYTSL